MRALAITLWSLLLTATARADDVADARKALAAGDRTRAIKLLEPAKTPAAKALLGELVEAENPERGVALLQEASDAGNADGKYRLALCVRDGRGIRKDRLKAEKLLIEVAATGHKPARHALASWWATGFRSKTRDGLRRLLELAKEGYEPAKYEVACYVMDRHKKGQPKLPRDYEPLWDDFDVCVSWVLDHAKRGNPDAQFRIAGLASFGTREELDWYRKAATQGHTAAQLALAMRLGTSRNEAHLKEACKWGRKAAVAGEPKGALEIGFALAKLAETDEDHVESYAWLLAYRKMGRALSKWSKEQEGAVGTMGVFRTKNEKRAATKRAKEIWKLVEAGVAARKKRR